MRCMRSMSFSVTVRAGARSGPRLPLLAATVRTSSRGGSMSSCTAPRTRISCPRMCAYRAQGTRPGRNRTVPSRRHSPSGQGRDPPPPGVRALRRWFPRKGGARCFTPRRLSSLVPPGRRGRVGELPASARADMCVPWRVFADRELIEQLAADRSLEQAAERRDAAWDRRCGAGDARRRSGLRRRRRGRDRASGRRRFSRRRRLRHQLRRAAARATADGSRARQSRRSAGDESRRECLLAAATAAR